MTAEFICEKLNLDINKIFNIYPYGSKIYGTNDEFSDDDFIIVYKSAFLENGSFKNNAISSDDKTIQGTCYSRSGFIDAINNYQISALECLFLPEEQIIKKGFDFKIQKFDKKELAKKIITTASSSWHNADLSYKDDNLEYAKKNVYHALRILDFGIQIKEQDKIFDYGRMNELKNQIDSSEDFKPKQYLKLFLELSSKLKT